MCQQWIGGVEVEDPCLYFIIDHPLPRCANSFPEFISIIRKEYKPKRNFYLPKSPVLGGIKVLMYPFHSYIMQTKRGQTELHDSPCRPGVEQVLGMTGQDRTAADHYHDRQEEGDTEVSSVQVNLHWGRVKLFLMVRWSLE